MILVLDASAGIEIVLNRTKAPDFRNLILNAQKIISSDLYKAETANVIWKYVRAGFLDKTTALEVLKLLQNLVDEFIDISENNEESLNEANKLNHPVYDLLYLTLARRNGAHLLTLNKQLEQLALHAGIEVNS